MIVLKMVLAFAFFTHARALLKDKTFSMAGIINPSPLATISFVGNSEFMRNP